MRKCEHCKEEMTCGHVMFDDEFYLCDNCFDKFYDEKISHIMYEEELQYYTEWEEDENA